jgi:hypothetical protein
MRPLGTWLVIGALALIGLFAVRDALRGKEAPTAGANAGSALAKRRLALAPQPPEIVSHDRLSVALSALGVDGVLDLTDADCRRFLLTLPELRWNPQGLPGPVCPNATPDVVNERFGLAATQVEAGLIEVSSETWRFTFPGTAPAFTPEGRLTFIRGGRLWEWTVQCPPAAERPIFRGLRSLERCPSPVRGALGRLRELFWLSGHDFVAVVADGSRSTLAVVRDGKPRTIFKAIGGRMDALETSPLGRYAAVRIDGDLAVFDLPTGRPVPLPPGADGPLLAVAWSPDDRFGVVASRRALHVYPMRRPWRGVTVPAAAIALSWR